MRRPFEWRDPVYKDKNVDAEEYDDYHVVDGLPTALRVTRFKNDEQLHQYYLVHVKYNQELPGDFWDVQRQRSGASSAKQALRAAAGTANHSDIRGFALSARRKDADMARGWAMRVEAELGARLSA